MAGLFESSGAGALAGDSILECGVCWWKYDPSTGDEQRDIPANIAFRDLPDDFRCPCCDAPKSKFMLLEGGQAAVDAGEEALADRLADLIASFQRAEAQMAELPIYNEQLSISAVHFEELLGAYTGIIITPWCMNIVRLPKSKSELPMAAIGASIDVAFPSGNYPFIVGQMDGIGTLYQCSLFSPMDIFDNQDVVEMVAKSAFEGLMQPAEQPGKESGEQAGTAIQKTDKSEKEAKAEPAPSRRAFLTGGRARSPEVAAE